MSTLGDWDTSKLRAAYYKKAAEWERFFMGPMWGTPPACGDENPAPPTGPTKPYGQAVGEVYRELKKAVQEREMLDGSIKETVTKELGDLADKHESKKPWPGSMP